MYIRRIVVPVKNYDIIYIYIYIYKHDRCFCCCFQNSRACSSRLACAFVVQLHVNIQHRSCLHDRCRMTQVAQVNATTSHREAFSFYILFRDVEPGKRACSSPWSFEPNRELVPRSTCPIIIQLHRYIFDHN